MILAPRLIHVSLKYLKPDWLKDNYAQNYWWNISSFGTSSKALVHVFCFNAIYVTEQRGFSISLFLKIKM